MSSIKDFKADIKVSSTDEGAYRFQTSSWRQRKSHSVDGVCCFFAALEQMALIAEIFGISDQAKETFARELAAVRERLAEKKAAKAAPKPVAKMVRGSK
jgi:ABC-type Fe3+-hydroxamate transport system substrate-binding protein